MLERLKLRMIQSVCHQVAGVLVPWAQALVSEMHEPRMLEPDKTAEKQFDLGERLFWAVKKGME